jgi:geranylgeranyl reductase family protein
MHDVLIIGGGPSGLQAARKLAGRGFDVLVLEKKKEVGQHIICTGIVSLGIFQEFGLARESALAEIKKMRVFSPFGSSVDYEHPRAFACVVDRERFDRSLGDKACEQGARILTDREALDISVGKDSVVAVAKRGKRFEEKYSASVVLIATGINYGLHRKLGLGYPRTFLKGVQAEIEIGQPDYTQVFLGKDIAPGAFAWLVPVGGGMARIGLMTQLDPEGYLERLIARFYPDRAIAFDKDHLQLKAIAQGLVSKTYGERVLAIGEAAGQVKTTTGGGIYFGLICADIASALVSERFADGGFSSQMLADYERRWRRAIQKEIRVGLSLRKLFSSLSDPSIEKLFRIAKNDGVIPIIREWADFDWHSDLVLALIKRMPWADVLKSGHGSFTS